MKKIALLLMVVALWAATQSDCQAQAFGYVTYYQPAPVYAAPIYPAPAPAPVYYSSYYAPAVVPAPVTRVRTRYRPILGGTVTRVRRAYYAPTVVYGF